MKLIYTKFAAITILVLASGLIAACGGDSAAADPTATTVPVPTATVEIPTATPEPTATSVPEPTAVPTEAPSTGDSEPSSEEQIAQGKLLFEKTAGGVGCALCHGMDAMGDPAQGAPSNLGADWESIEQALYDRPQMSFISLSRDEVKAIAAYLRWLEEQQ